MISKIGSVEVVVGEKKKGPHRKRLEKANTQAALNEVIGHFIERYQLPNFLRETLYE